MPDPADVIAEILLRPPAYTDPGSQPAPEGTETCLLWQFQMMMGHPGAPAVAQRVAAEVVQAFTDGGWKLVPPGAPHLPLPTPDQVRAWLARNEWMPRGGPGVGGTLWYPPVRGRGVGIPHDGDPFLIEGAIKRIADRMGMTAGQVTAEMMVYTP